MKPRTLGALFLLVAISLNEPTHTQALIPDLDKAKDFTSKEFDCRLKLGTIQGSNKCSISVIQQNLVIDVKGETIKIPLGHIFALNVTTQTTVPSSYVRKRTIGDIYVGFITKPDAQIGNRTNFLHASTVYERELFALQEEMANQLKASPRASFSDTVPLQNTTPENQAEIPRQVEQLIKTKTCVRCDLRSAKLESIDLQDANLEGTNLQGANLSGANLENAYLIGATLDGAKITNANLNNAMLLRASMPKVNLEHSQLKDANLQGANLAKAILRSAQLDRGDKSYVNFSEADLSDAVLSGANMVRSNLQKANLQGANLKQSNAGGLILSTDLYSANLSEANLSNANLEEARLTEADLRGATLSSANLKGTNLRYANLRNANLQGANLKDADFTRADLCMATMSDGKPSTQICSR